MVLFRGFCLGFFILHEHHMYMNILDGIIIDDGIGDLLLTGNEIIVDGIGDLLLTGSEIYC